MQADFHVFFSLFFQAGSTHWQSASKYQFRILLKAKPTLLRSISHLAVSLQLASVMSRQIQRMRKFFVSSWCWLEVNICTYNIILLIFIHHFQLPISTGEWEKQKLILSLRIFHFFNNAQSSWKNENKKKKIAT